MESKPSFLRHGVLRLPPGFRFHPTDEELVVQYLRRKVFSCPLPASIIPEINLAKLDPWDLPGGCGEERYCFNLREAKYRNGSWSNRAARSGYWKKATRKDEQITSPRCSSQVVGMKKVLVFYRGKPPTGTKTDWVMHEYRLAGTESTTACIFPQRHNNSTHRSAAPSGDWVLCRIFQKKRATKMDVETEGDDELPVTNSGIGFIDLMGRRDRDQNHSSSLSESSCITELSGGSSNGEETSSRSSIP
ncbi:hypothetical protein OPV22_016187 [Ensete ventricosum]|uniref:NAC domain-containing protein n=1 Tax=Ensete ventricosum TaxID=4639 RepID=A0AAV8QY30_ENSVE|nr:hypothetical protein OPV22_016187 [Ensete ventricosum]